MRSSSDLGATKTASTKTKSNSINSIYCYNPSLGVRQGLASGLSRAVKDDNVDAVVICGKGTFIGGADITEFSTGEYNTGECYLGLTFQNNNNTFNTRPLGYF